MGGCAFVVHIKQNLVFLRGGHISIAIFPFQQRFDPVNPMTCAVHATYKGSEDLGKSLYS